MSEKSMPEEIIKTIQEGRANPELRSKVDEIRTGLHSVVTELDELITDNGTDLLKNDSGKTRVTQARHYVHQIYQLVGSKERAKFIIEDTLSAVKNAEVYRAIVD